MAQEDTRAERQSGPRRPRARRIARALLLGALVMAAIYAALLAAAPALVSSSMVRGAMERSVSQWTGEQATIGDTPRISFWPEPEIELPSVTIARSSASGEVVLARIERLSANFGLFAALRGEPAFSDFRLIRPVFYLTRRENGRIVWTGGGRLGAAIEQARSETGTRADRSDRIDAEIGSVTVEEGAVELYDEVSGRTVAASGITGAAKWPRLSSSLEASAKATLEGRSFTFSFSADRPLTLFAGKDANVALSLAAPGFSGRFSGSANIAGAYLLSGPLQLDVPDMPAFLAWTGWRGGYLSTVKQANLSTEILTIESGLQLDRIDAELDGNDISGVLDLQVNTNGRPRLGGTLAFDTIDLAALADALALRPGQSPAAASLMNDADVDVTLSAGTASAPGLTLQDMAASVLILNNRRQFDIADSDFEGGRLTAQLTDATQGSEGQLQISARDIDLTALFDRMGTKGPLPRARASVDLALTLSRPLREMLPSELKGKLRIATGGGTMEGVNLEGIRALAGERSYFRLSEAGSATLPFNRLDISANISHGSAEVENARMETNDGTMIVSGIVSYAQGSLALLAEWPNDAEKSSDAQPQISVFLGGSWPDPVVSPTAQAPPQQLQ